MATKDQDLIKRIQDRFKRSSDATTESYQDMVDDLEFLKGEQWPENLRKERERDGRPCLIINKIPTFHDQVIGDQRQNRPRIKVLPVDDESDTETATILTGLIRNIENISNADVAYDHAFDAASACGFGAFRIVTDYADDATFDQDILIKRIKNQFTCYFDPDAQEIDYSDGEYCFVTEKMPREAYRRKYPNASPCEFDASRDTSEWITHDQVRVAEYFEREQTKKRLYLIELADGAQMTLYKSELPPEGVDYEVLKERTVESTKIMWYRVNGREILEGPTEWPGKYFPIIPVFGKELQIQGNTYHRGIVRNAKDSQRLYNYNRSQHAETSSLAPKSPYIATPTMTAGFEGQWQTAHKRNYPVLFVNPDSKFPGYMPQRQPPIPVNPGLQNEVMVADQELHDTTGLQQASLGKRGDEKSGKAILARQREGDVGQFSYVDNLARAISQAGRVLVDLIPKIYDTARVVRILNEDESEEQVAINQPTERNGIEKIFDLNMGKYDTTVTVGPSYSTQRQEAADSMIAFMKALPESGPLMGDLIAKNMDWPGAQEISERFKKILPPGLAEPSDEERQKQEMMQGGQPGQPGAPPPGPPPEDAAAMETGREIDIEKAEVQLAQEKLQLEQERLQLEIYKEDLRRKEAQARKAELEVSEFGRQSDE